MEHFTLVQELISICFSCLTGASALKTHVIPQQKIKFPQTSRNKNPLRVPRQTPFNTSFLDFVLKKKPVRMAVLLQYWLVQD